MTAPVVGQVGAGRPRDAGIDSRVLAVTRELLATVGYEALSVAKVAAAAGTTRAAVYRRWADKADLATAAVAAMPEAAGVAPSEDPFADLVAELQAFHRGVGRPDGLPMVGTMLQGVSEPELVERYRERLVRPRRTRLRAILDRAVTLAALDPAADLELAVSTFTGSWYAAALAGQPPDDDWPERIAALVWRGCGGTPPDRQSR